MQHLMTRSLAILLLATSTILAGCVGTMDKAMGNMQHAAGGPDTGDIAPGANKTLTFDTLGTIAMHCHPHPFMLHNVTVTNDPPAPAHVHIVDGLETRAYAFEPQNITIGKGSVVTYHNHGTNTHTATLKPADM